MSIYKKPIHMGTKGEWREGGFLAGKTTFLGHLPHPSLFSHNVFTELHLMFYSCQLWDKILQIFHDWWPGIKSTYQRAKRVCYWPKLKEAVHAYVRSCDVCQMHKVEHIHTLGLLQPIPPPEGPWQGVSMDLISGLPRSEGKEVIFCVHKLIDSGRLCSSALLFVSKREGFVVRFLFLSSYFLPPSFENSSA